MSAPAPKPSITHFIAPLTYPNHAARLADRVSVHRPQLAVARACVPIPVLTKGCLPTHMFACD